MPNLQPGAGDPYWNEWFIGLEYVLDLLDDSTGIAGVTFQAENIIGLDDLIISYASSAKQGIQIKYVLEETQNKNLTFSDLVKVDKKGLISLFSQGWAQLNNDASKCESCVLVTNKALSTTSSTGEYEGVSYSRSSLFDFWIQAKSDLKTAVEISDISYSGDMGIQWKAFLEAIDLNDSERLAFLKTFDICLIEEDFNDHIPIIKQKIQTLFQCDVTTSERLFQALISQLPTWTTTLQRGKEITKEDLLRVFSCNDQLDVQLAIMVPLPFLPSRKVFSDSLETFLKDFKGRALFLSGVPGIGKSTLTSFLSKNYKNVYASYHAHQPLAPGVAFNKTAVDRVSARYMWSQLFMQLKRYFSGRFASMKIPVSYRPLSESELKNHTLRMAHILYEETNENVVLIVDGLDHAARSGLPQSFLDSLPSPEYIPEGVVFLIAGQPQEQYDEYPNWLKNGCDLLETLDVPGLDTADVSLLLDADTSIQDSPKLDLLADYIHQKTSGNTLSAMYAIREISEFLKADEAIAHLQNSKLSYDLEDYYADIWSQLVRSISRYDVLLDVKIASILVLMDGYLSLDDTAAVLHIGSSDLGSLIKRIFPLVDIDNEKVIRVFNNDFLLFLRRMVSQDINSSCFENTATSLAEFLEESDASIASRKYPIDILLRVGQLHKALSCFSARYVVEALAVGVSWETLKRQAYTLYLKIPDEQDILVLTHFFLALKTLQQHYEYFNYYERARPSSGNFDIEESKYYPLEIKIENIPVFNSLLRKAFAIRENQDSGESDKLVQSWFQGLDPYEFLVVLNRNSSFINVDTDLSQLYRSWGEYASARKIRYETLADKFQNLSGSEENYLEDFYKGLYCYCKDSHLSADLVWALEAYGFTLRVAREHLYAYMRDEFYSFQEYGVIGLRHFAKSNYINTETLIGKAAAVADSHTKDIEEEIWVLPLEEGLHLSDVWLIAFLDGYYNNESDYERFRYATMDDSRWNEARNWIDFVVMLGKVTKKGEMGQAEQQLITERSNQLFCHPQRLSIDYNESFSFLHYLLLRSDASLIWDEAIDISSVASLLGRDINIDVYAMHYLGEHGLERDSKNYLTNLLGVNGENILLNDDPLGRIEAVSSAIATFLPEKINEFKSKMQWNIVGVLAHKDYYISKLVDLFEILSSRNPMIWQSLGRKLFATSSICDTCGDNRGSSRVNSALYNAASVTGIESLAKMRTWDELMFYDQGEVLDQAYSLINSAQTAEELELIFLLFVGLNSFYSYTEMHSLCKVLVQLQDVAHNNGLHFDTLLNEKHPELVKAISEFETILEPYTPKIERNEKLELFRKEIESMSSDQLIDTLASVCEGERADGMVNAIVQLLNNNHDLDEQQNFTYKKILLTWYRELAEFGYYSYSDESLSVLSEYFGLEFIFEALPSRNQEWFEQYNFLEPIAAIEISLKHLLKLADLGEAERSFMDLCGVISVWLSGAGHVPFELAEPEDGVISPDLQFQQLVLQMLLPLSENDIIRKRHAALQGMRYIVSSFPSLFENISQSWNSLPSRQRQGFLELSECWNPDSSEYWSFFESLIDDEDIRCDRIDNKLRLHAIQGMQNGVLALEPFLRCTFEPANLSFSDNIVHEEIAKNQKLYLQASESQKAPVIYAYIKHCEEEESRWFRHEKYASSHDLALPDTLCEIPGWKVLYGFEYTESLKSDSIQKKTGCILGSDSPYLFTSPPIFLKNDIQETADFSKSDEMMRYLERLAFQSLPNSTTLLGCSVYYPDKNGDCTLTLTSSISEHEQESCISLGNISLVGWHTGFYELYPNNDSIVNVIGGGIEGPYSSPNIVLSNSFCLSASLHSKPYSPFVYLTNEEKVVIEYQRIVLPLANTDTFSPYYAQPTISRWICEEGWLECFLKESNNKLSYIRDINYAKWER